VTQAQAETRKRVVGRPFRKGRDPRRNAGARRQAAAEPEQDVRAWAKSVVDDPKVRQRIKRMAQRGQLSAPMLKNLLERAAGIVKEAAEPQGASERDEEARRLAAGMRRNLSQEERMHVYGLLRKSRDGRAWDDGLGAVRAQKAERPELRVLREPPPARPALPESAGEGPEPEAEVVELVPEDSPQDWREEAEWRRHLARCQDPRSCNDSGRSHPSHGWRRLTRLP
jgi:hypothetical protein